MIFFQLNQKEPEVEICASMLESLNECVQVCSFFPRQFILSIRSIKTFIVWEGIIVFCILGGNELTVLLSFSKGAKCIPNTEYSLLSCLFLFPLN